MSICGCKRATVQLITSVCCTCITAFLWPPYGIGQAIIFLSSGFFYLLSIFYLFPRLISAVGDWMSTDTWCGLSANLECRSETCRTRLVGNAGRKKPPKIHHLGTIAQLYGTISSQLSHVWSLDNRKKLLKQ